MTLWTASNVGRAVLARIQALEQALVNGGGGATPAQIAAINAQITVLQTQLASANVQITTHTSQIAGLTARVTALEAGVGGGAIQPYIETASQGMNVHVTEYDDFGDILRNAMYRTSLNLGGKTVLTDIDQLPRVTSDPTVGLSGDGLPASNGGATVRFNRTTQRFQVGNCAGSGLTRSDVWKFLLPYQTEPGRTNGTNLFIWASNVPFVAYRGVDYVPTGGAIPADGPETYRRLCQMPSSENGRVTAMQAELSTVGLPDDFEVLVDFYPVAETSGPPNYTRTDPNKDLFWTDQEIERNAIFASLRFLDPLAINQDRVPGSTVTAFAQRTPAMVCGGYSTRWSIEQCVNVCNSIASGSYQGIGAHIQISQRDRVAGGDWETIKTKAAKWANLRSNNNRIEYGNENTFNTGFTTLYEDAVNGCRSGYDEVGRTTADGATPREVWYDGSTDPHNTMIIDIPAGKNIFIIRNGSNGYVLKALTSKVVGDGVPSLTHSTSSAYPTVGTEVTSSDIVYKSIQAVPTGIALSNTAYWMVSDSWAVAVNSTQTARAGDNWRANQSLGMAKFFREAFAARGKPAPKLKYDVQHSSSSQVISILPWTATIEGEFMQMKDVYEGRINAPYIGNVGSINVNGFTNNLDNRSGHPTGYDAVDRAALFDASLTGNAAVARLRDGLLSPEVRHYLCDIPIGQEETAANAIEAWFTANYPERGYIERVDHYEMGFQIQVTSGWPDHAASWSSATTFNSTAPGSASSYTRRTTDGWPTTYRNLVAGNIGFDPLTNPDKWEKISNWIDPVTGDQQQRTGAFWRTVLEDPRLGLVRTYWMQQHVSIHGARAGLSHGYYSQDDVTKTSAVVSSFSYRDRSDNIDYPMWASAIRCGYDLSGDLVTGV